MKVLNLNKYKELQKNKKIKSELYDILQLLNVMLIGLNNYKKYKYVREIIDLVKMNRDLLKPFYKKYKKLANENKN